MNIGWRFNSARFHRVKTVTKSAVKRILFYGSRGSPVVAFGDFTEHPVLVTLCFVYFVYILQSKKDNKLYIGYTEDLENRRPLELIYYEAYKNKLDAKKREVFLKSGSGHRFIQKQMVNYFESRKSGF